MKTRILSQLFLVASLGIIYITMSSDSDGRAMSGTSCNSGSCHGNINTATTVALNGVPSAYIPGQTYSLTFTVINTTNNKAGCNIAATAGTFTAGTGTKLKGGQITHISPLASSGSVATFTCFWIAPATTGPVTISAAGNAVNGDLSASSADQWNTTSVTISNAAATSVNDITTTSLTCYPNPADNFIIAEGINAQTKAIVLYNLTGQPLVPVYTFDGNNCRIDCTHLTKGMYFLSAVNEGKHVSASFIKN
jgi:hypothetical protein